MKPNQFISVVCLLLAILLVAMDRGVVPVPVPVPVPPTTLHAIIIEESADRTPDLAVILLSPEVRGLFGMFRVIDPDTEVHSDLRLYIDRVPRLPWLFLIDDKGKVWYEGDVPLTVEGWRQLVSGIKQ